MVKAAPPVTAHDARLDALSRRLKKALIRLQKEAELHMLEDLLVAKVISSGHRRSKWRRQSQAAFREEENLPRREALPSMWTSPIPLKAAPLTKIGVRRVQERKRSAGYRSKEKN